MCRDGTGGAANEDEFSFYSTPRISISTRGSTPSSTRNRSAFQAVRARNFAIVMFGYIVLAVVVGTACAAPASPAESPEPSPLPNPTPVPTLLKVPSPERSPLPTLTSDAVQAASSSSAAELALPAPLPSSAAGLALPAGRSPASSGKALSLISEIKTPASTAKLAHVIAPIATPIAASPILSPLQVSAYAYALPAPAPVELVAAPSSYSIEQHGYRITY
ncbi:putative uncharacterized protein DDB_G0290521 [Hylaeus volcanicus]|uniref:putative uncharacterized protein DDB_G0290521 n=1 Tax=Hylaeus volcanicus TaxID=313075 RepID=UPI0023B7C215|nr:putative uncharacterized protein DDB_G0290521 [Hylaeus volcanicus]